MSIRKKTRLLVNAANLVPLNATIEGLEPRQLNSASMPPASELVASSPPSPTITVTDSHNRTYSLYTRQETDVRTGGIYVVVSYIHAGQGAWTRRIIRPEDASEFISPTAIPRSWISSIVSDVSGAFSGVFHSIQDVVNTAENILKPLIADGSKLLKDVEQLIKDGSTFITDLVGAAQQIRSAGSAMGLKAYLTTALAEQSSSTPLYLKMSNAFAAACQASPDAAPMLALAVDSMPQ